MRADVLLVERGLAPSRTAAQRLIAGGHVYTRAGREGTRPQREPGDTPAQARAPRAARVPQGRLDVFA